jgi:hypothetical protein
MKEASLDYPTFWALVSSKSLLPQYVDTGDRYIIFAAESSISWETVVQKDGGTNQVDFEANHQASCNDPLEYRSKDGIPEVASAMFTDALTFWVDGSNGYLQISAGQIAYLTTNFSVPYKLNGVDIQWINANMGDYANLDVGVYSGGDPTNQSTFIQIAQFANEYRIMGNGEKSFILDTVSTVPPTYNGLNVYIRTTYVNTGSNTANFCVNLLGYK